MYFFVLSSDVTNCVVCQVYNKEPRSVVDRRKLEQLYNRYREPSEPEKIGRLNTGSRSVKHQL